MENLSENRAELTRRQFFCALVASAVAAGVPLPVEKSDHLGEYRYAPIDVWLSIEQETPSGYVTVDRVPAVPVPGHEGHYQATLTAEHSRFPSSRLRLETVSVDSFDEANITVKIG